MTASSPEQDKPPAASGRPHVPPAPDSGEPAREQLVQHLVACMEQAGITIEAADAPGHPRPKPVKLIGRGSRLRPDVVGLDGRRKMLGKVMTAAELGDSRLRGQLETLARNCRTLVVCIPEAAAGEARDTVFGADLEHRAKIRLLLHPRAQWEELPRRAPAPR
jgi:hypothetical protein